MNIWQISEIKSTLKNQITNSNFVIKSDISEIIIDSRKKTEAGLFVAIKGENNDGHEFLKGAFENGVVAAIVERIPAGFENDSRLILVKNSFDALKNLAIAARQRFKGKIIAVTGSVGKTGVKDMLRIVFSSQGKTFATSGNLNNHFGLPLSLANLPVDYDFGIFEMGMNHLGEIEPLSKMACADLAIITTVAPAHIGNFKNEEEIALAKSEIFSGLKKSGFAVINEDNRHKAFLKNQARKYLDEKNIFSFGQNELSSVRLFTIQNLDINKSKIDVKACDKLISYDINTINEATIFNSLIAVTALKLIGNNFDLGIKALTKLETPKGRGNIILSNKNGLNLTIIDDSYNANITSIIAGLKFLANLRNFKPKSRLIAAIGDMLELGKTAQEQHKQIAKYVLENKIDGVVLVGELTENTALELPKAKILGHFKNSTLASQKILSFLQNDDILLIKGSRGIRMEKLLENLV